RDQRRRDAGTGGEPRGERGPSRTGGAPVQRQHRRGSVGADAIDVPGDVAVEHHVADHDEAARATGPRRPHGNSSPPESATPSAASTSAHSRWMTTWWT